MKTIYKSNDSSSYIISCITRYKIKLGTFTGQFVSNATGGVDYVEESSGEIGVRRKRNEIVTETSHFCCARGFEIVAAFLRWH